jgi:TrmH family RNA methyltransferase
VPTTVRRHRTAVSFDDDKQALARTCLAAGVRGIIVTGDADLHDPACVRATMGALDALELVRTTPHELVALVRRSRGRLIGAAPDGGRDYRAISYRGPTVVLVGSERSGISDAMRAVLDITGRIPMTGAIDSLNLAVAGSLILYEAYAQRR